MMLRNAALQIRSQRVASRSLPLRLSASFATRAAASESAGKCPITGASSSSSNSRGHSSVALGDAAAPPQLKDVPAVPIFGAFVTAVPGIGQWLNDTFYKLPEIKADNAYEYHTQMYERFGSFYTTYIPGLGAEGLYPKVYMVMDPGKKTMR